MIIDCHTHIFPPALREGRENVSERERGFLSIYQSPKAKMVGVEELIAAMDESEVERSVICGFPWKEPDLCSLHNDYLLESVSRYPQRLIAFIGLPMDHPDEAALELERGLKNGTCGVGEIGYYDREMTSEDIAMMAPVLTRLERGGLPLLLHTNENIGHPYPGKGRTPLERFYELILNHPHLKVVLGHWGGGLVFYELMPEVARVMTNVFYDTAASPYLYSKRIYAIAREIVGPEKILFGTDFPLISAQRYLLELKESGLGGEDQQKILGGNLSKLLASESGGGSRRERA